MNQKRRRWWRRYGIVVALFVAMVLVVAFLVEAHFRTQPDPAYSKIDTELYMGEHVSSPPRGTEAVLNLCEAEDPYRTPAYRWSPIHDAAPAPTIEWLRDQVEFVAEQRVAGRMVYVHCLAGHSRSALVVVAYLMQDRGWSRDEALAYVRRKRPSANPNPAFMQLLLEWERVSKKP